MTNEHSDPATSEPRRLQRVEARIVDAVAIRVAVREGIVAAASDPQVWAAAITTLRMQAQAEAGGWLFGGIKAALSRIAWVVFIGLGIYLLGGWGALVAFFKSGSAAA